jgi:hypothetical protein
MVNKLQNAQNESEYNNLISEFESNLKNNAFESQKAVLESDSGIIKSTNASASDFGNYMGSGNANSKQSKYVNAMIDAARNGKLADGTVVNMNYGVNASTNEGYYMYSGGMWTKVDKDAYNNAANKIYYGNAEEKGIKYKG